MRQVAEMLRGVPLRGWLAGVWAEVVDAWFPCMCAVCGAATRLGGFLCDGCAIGVIRLRRAGGVQLTQGDCTTGGSRGEGVGQAGGNWGEKKEKGAGEMKRKEGGGLFSGPPFSGPPIAITGREEGGVNRRGNATRGGALCVCCSRLFEGAEAAHGEFCGPCAECTRLRPAFLCAVAPVKAAGAVREVVHAFKYEGRRHLCKLLADWMQEGLADPRLCSPPVEALVPVPLHRSRLRTRGFNQAGLLAAELGRRTGVEVLDVLERVRSTGSQAQLGRDERLGNLRGAFQLKRTRLGADSVRRGAASIAGRHIVLVDDVLTTGATLDACARALLESNPGSVRALTVARG